MAEATLPYSSYCKVVGQLILSTADTNLDPDKFPDGVFGSGTVTMKPQVTGGLLKFLSAGVGVFPKTIVLVIDAQGFPSINGERECYVPPTDDPQGTPLDWTYLVEFNVAGPDGVKLNIPSYSIAAPRGTELNIFTASPSADGGGVIQVQGPPGKSAFEIAVDNGYVGTEEDWLLSLAPMSEEAIDVKIGAGIAENFVETIYANPLLGIQATLDSAAQIATEPRYGSAMTSGTTAPVRADAIVPGGLWPIPSALRMPDGVTLHLDDRAIVKATSAMSVMIDTDINVRYSGVGIYGGIWDCNNLAQAAVYVRWAGHFTVDIKQIRNAPLHGIIFGDPAAATASFEGFIGPVFIVRPNNQAVPAGSIGVWLRNATDCVVGTRKGTIIVGQDIQVRADGAAHTIDGVHPWGFGSTPANGNATGLTPTYSFYINAQRTKIIDTYADGVKAGGAGYYFTSNATGCKMFGPSAFLNDITDTPDNSADAFYFEVGARVSIFGPVVSALSTKRWRTDYAGSLTNVNVFGQTYENVVTVNKPVTPAGYGAWADTTPTIYDSTGTVVSPGTTPTRFGRYRADSATVEFTGRITFGATPGAGSGSWFIGTPGGLTHGYTTTTAVGSGWLFDTSAGVYKPVTVYALGSDPGKLGLLVDPTGPVSGTAPWAWAAGDAISIQGRYERAA